MKRLRSKIEIRNSKLDARPSLLPAAYCRPPRYCLLPTACCLLLTAAMAMAQQSASPEGSPPPPDTSAPPPAGTAAQAADPKVPPTNPTEPTAPPPAATPGFGVRGSGLGEADDSSQGPNPETPNSVPAPTKATSPDSEGRAPTVNEGAREIPLDAEPFDARIHRRIEEFGQRHQQREHEMASYDKVSGSDPGLERFADPRKVQVELGDELDREQTSDELAGDYAQRAHDLQSKVQALQDFITKRRQTLDELGQQGGGAHRQELEVALANLARQPGSPETMAEMREIDRQLSEADRNQKETPAQFTQAQQEATGAAEELTRLKALEQSYEKESKAFVADALSARQNRLRLANRLEYYLVRAQAEDELEQGRKAMASVQHLSASPEVESALNGSGSSVRSDANLAQLRDCIQQSGDVRACREKIRQE